MLDEDELDEPPVPLSQPCTFCASACTRASIFWSCAIRLSAFAHGFFVGGVAVVDVVVDVEPLHVCWILAIRVWMFESSFCSRCSTFCAKSRHACGTLLALPRQRKGVVAQFEISRSPLSRPNPERQDREELSIVGFDGIEETTWTTPALTTVEQPIAQIADTAVQTLQTLIEQPTRPLPNSYFRPVLRVRGSTAAPAKASAARRPVSAARRS